MSKLLAEIVRSKYRELAQQKHRQPQATLERLIEEAPRPRGFLRSLLEPPGTAIIAEIKRRSPSAGLLTPHLDVSARAQEYAAGGARAISVLVDGPFFGGSYRDIQLVRSTLALPILAKEFVVDEYQLLQARCAGADAVLLISRILQPAKLAQLLGRARQLGLDCLVEVHSSQELAALPILPAEAAIGINNRNLDTLKTTIETTIALLPLVPPQQQVVSESGIRGPEDVRLLRRHGIQAFLIGETLMKEHAPKRLLEELLR